jgi:hypothetical protein
MATTFNFEELDEATHDYLVAVRDSGGRGSPGVFAETKDALPGCGCIAGPIIIIATLVLTLTTAINVVYDDPVRVGLLQTAGLMLGVWLLFARFRGGRGTNKYAGTWVYADPLFLYEAFREQITITEIEEVEEASFTHNYNNGNYQNSVVRVSLGGKRVVVVTLTNEARAEQLVVYLNYLAWARGSDGGERANLAPATLGGLAKYVAKNDHEPLDSENNINLNMVELDITEVPEDPQREGRSIPGFLPYVFLLIFGVLCFFVMAYIINPPIRDDAIYDAVTKQTSPPTIEPRFLRAYLVDPRNTRHREDVTKKLSEFYRAPIQHVEQNGKDPELSKGMAKMLDSLRTADQPVVSVRVTEEGTPAGMEGSKATRENQLRTDFAMGVNKAFSDQPWGRPIQPPAGMTFPQPPPPIGEQLIAFIEPPEGAEQVHFDIKYTIKPADFGQSEIRVTVEIRTNIEDKNPTARSEFKMPGKFKEGELDAQIPKIKDELVLRMIGPANNPQPQPGGFLPPPGGFRP